MTVLRKKAAPARARDWFTVDRDGLARQIPDKGRVVAELVSNAWDESVTEVVVSLVPTERANGGTRLIVSDDAPEGFSDLRHAYTLFAPTRKQADAEVRGRFNLGEKLVLALASEASIRTTTGSVLFDRRGRRCSTKRATEKGSIINAVLRLNRLEREAADAFLLRLLPPVGIRTVVNGRTLHRPDPLRTFRAGLPTVVAGEDGFLRRTPRETDVTLLPRDLDDGWIFELGIPVAPWEGPWNVDVGQKIPLSKDRSEIDHAWLKKLAELVLNEAHDLLPAEAARDGWVSEAMGNAEPEAVKAVLDARFGEHRVSYDPSDPEANSRAMAAGYKVIYGPELPAEAWAQSRDHGLVEPAGQRFPTHPGEAEAMVEVPEAEWTDEARAVIEEFRVLARALLGRTIHVMIHNNPRVNQAACWGNDVVRLNVGRLRWGWFAVGNRVARLALLIHELAHSVEANHLSDRFHDACCDLGAKLAVYCEERS